MEAPDPDATTDSFIYVRPSSSHADISVRLASSPSPNNADTAVSRRGSGCGFGSVSAERDNASRVKPWVRTRGRASFNSSFLGIVLCYVSTKALWTTHTPERGHGRVQVSRWFGSPARGPRDHALGFLNRSQQLHLSRASLCYFLRSRARTFDLSTLRPYLHHV